jgi:hypothetical protein
LQRIKNSAKGHIKIKQTKATFLKEIYDEKEERK